MRKSMMWQVVVLLAFFPGVAGSQTIYKCTVKGKPTVYQNDPCAANATVSGVLNYQPEAAPTYEQQRARQAREARGRQESAYLSRLAGTDRRGSVGSVHVLPIATSECERVKRDRDAWEKANGLSWTYDGLKAWNDAVQRACK